MPEHSLAADQWAGRTGCKGALLVCGVKALLILAVETYGEYLTQATNGRRALFWLTVWECDYPVHVRERTMDGPGGSTVGAARGRDAPTFYISTEMLSLITF